MCHYSVAYPLVTVLRCSPLFGFMGIYPSILIAFTHAGAIREVCQVVTLSRIVRLLQNA